MTQEQLSYSTLVRLAKLEGRITEVLKTNPCHSSADGKFCATGGSKGSKGQAGAGGAQSFATSGTTQASLKEVKTRLSSLMGSSASSMTPFGDRSVKADYSSYKDAKNHAKKLRASGLAAYVVRLGPTKRGAGRLIVDTAGLIA